MSRLATEIHREARHQAIRIAILRTETLAILAIVTVLITLCIFNIFWFPESWWVWLLLGVSGAGLIVIAGSRDRHTIRKFVGKRIESRVNLTNVHIPELQANVGRAMFQHRTIVKLLHERRENVDNIMQRVDEWVLLIYEISHGLDTVMADPKLVSQYQQVLGDSRVHELLHDPISAVANAGAIVARENVNHPLVHARDVVLRVRRELNISLDHIITVNTALRKARMMRMQGEHIDQLLSAMDLQLIALNEAQDAVYQLGFSYELALK